MNVAFWGKRAPKFEHAFLISDMHSICVWNMIKQSKPLQTRYERTYANERYYIRTHVYVFLLSRKKRVFELSRV